MKILIVFFEALVLPILGWLFVFLGVPTLIAVLWSFLSSPPAEKHEASNHSTPPNFRQVPDGEYIVCGRCKHYCCGASAYCEKHGIELGRNQFELLCDDWSSIFDDLPTSD